MKKLFLSAVAGALLSVLLVQTGCTQDPDVDTTCRVEVPTSPLSIDGVGGDLTLDVRSNAYWNLSAVDSEGNTLRWMTFDPREGMGDARVTITVARNTTASERTASVVVATDDGNSSMTVQLTQGAGVASTSGYDFPLADMFLIDDNYQLSNGFIDGNSCYLDGGLVITRTGSSDSGLTFVCPCHNASKNQYYQRGLVAGNWNDGDAWLLEIPVKEDLSGDLRYGFGSRRDNILSGNPWKLEWSSDGTTFHAFSGATVQGASEAVWKLAEFTIPAEQKVPAGGKLLIRMTPDDPTNLGSASDPGTVLFQHGFQVFSASAPRSELPSADTERIVFSCGFDDLCDVDNATDITLDQGFFNSCRGGSYGIPEALRGLVSIINGYDRPGYLHLGTSTSPGTFSVTLKHLEEMNILRTDVKVSLRAAAVQSVLEPVDGDIRVTVDGESGATADNEGRAGTVKANVFGEVSAIIRGATPETVVTISNANTEIEHRFCIDDILIEVEGEPERPDASTPTKCGIDEVRALYSGSAVQIGENHYLLGRVVSTDNVPEGCFALADTESGLFVKAAVDGVVPGDEVRVVVLNASLDKVDGLLVLTPDAGAEVGKTGEPVEEPVPVAIAVSDLAGGACEGLYVEMPASQVIDADLSRSLGGEVTFETASGDTYAVKTLQNASFASQSVPQGSGPVFGIVAEGKLMPVSADDVARMTAARFGEKVYAITPVSEFFLADPTTLSGEEYSVYGCTLDGENQLVTFDSGNTVQRMGGTSDRTGRLAAVASQLYNGRFITTGWSGEDVLDQSMVIRMKAASELKGTLRFGFGWQTASKANVPKTWKVEWSTDGSQWNGGVEVAVTPFVDFAPTFAVTNASPFKMSRFTLPEGTTVPAGSDIWMRIVPTTTDTYGGGALDSSDPLYLHHGFYLSTDTERAYHTSDLPSDGNVVFTYGFDEAIHGHDYFIPARHFLSNPANLYIPAGWTGTGETRECPGYVMFGGNSNAKKGSLTTPELTKLGDTPTDITVKFKLAFFMPANYASSEAKTLAVAAVNAGTVVSQPDYSSIPVIRGATIAEMEQTVATYVKWYDYEVRITGATAQTQITFSTTAGRHFLDDIVVVRD